MITKKTKKTNLLATCAIIALLTTSSYSNQGVYIVEPFNCEVALLDYAELQKRLEVTPRTDWKYPIFLFEYQVLVSELEAHAECEVK